jgi:hypothetical protein
MSTLSIVFYLLCILAILSEAPLQGTSPNWIAVFDEAARYILAAGLALLVNIFFNKAAIFAVGDFGMVIRSAYDLFRMDLLGQFRLEQPENSGKEFELWQNLGELIVLGQDSLDLKHMEHKIKTK